MIISKYEFIFQAFYPKISFNDESDVSENTLRELMQKCMVSDAIQVYQICKTKGVGMFSCILELTLTCLVARMDLLYVDNFFF